VIGLVQAAIAVGGLLGAVVAPRLQGRMRLATLATTITLAGALLFGAAALLVQHTSGAWAVGAFAATTATAAVLCLAMPGLRQAQGDPRS
jgi:hypothetical protein